MTTVLPTAARLPTGSLADLPMSSALLAAVPVAWLVPNHYFPWSSAWQDGMALLLLLLAALVHPRATRLPVPWAIALAVAVASVALQWATGLILFGGDALIAAFYLAALALALAMGGTLSGDARPGQVSSLDAVAFGLVICAVLSVAAALFQWTSVHALGIYVADLPPGARPFGNVAQANQLCTLVFMGLCGLALLHENGRIGASGFWFAATFLTFGMAMSVSRTGWVQVGVLVAMVSVLQWCSSARVRPVHAAGLALIFFAWTAAWPLLNDLLLLTGGRGVTAQADGGARGPLWWSLLDALAREPMTGYGWQQVIIAQQAVALDHPASFHLFEHSHNILLDILVWAGIPVGLLIVGLLGWSLLRQVRAAQDARVTWLLVLVLGMLAHAMLELPHEYAYLLLPTGVAVGAAHALAPQGRTWPVPGLVLRGYALLMLIGLGLIAVEYFRAEQGYRLMRLESARIGVYGLTTPPPELPMLTQLGAFQNFVHTEARLGMTPSELETMRRVSIRFAYPPAMFRYALALALNGRQDEARVTLARLCRIHEPTRCDEAREGWRSLQGRYPGLAEVPF
ncbi:MAG: Wzy polymerase domain-containing protein [Rubrivivax sp.]|nr:Wzy polymerase domain-containing protein [Rubrivivax sp.]